MNQANASIEGSGSVIQRVHKIFDLIHGELNQNRMLLQYNISSEFQAKSFISSRRRQPGQAAGEGNMVVDNPVSSSLSPLAFSSIFSSIIVFISIIDYD